MIHFSAPFRLGLTVIGVLLISAVSTARAEVRSESGPVEKPVASDAIRALIVTGHNNHNWQYTSRIHAETLEATGRFTVQITDDPADYLSDANKLAGVGVIVLDYNDMHAPKRWGPSAEQNFLHAVQNGTGVVAIHSANNAFAGWTEYEKLLGLMWREGTGHGEFHSFDIAITEAEHPIMKGMGEIKNHPDELYHKLVNSQKSDFKLLAQAMSAKEKGGTGQNEPMAMTLQYGKGRVFATPLGHVWTGDEKTKVSVVDPALRSLIARGAEWAATSVVTLPPEWKDHRQHNVLSSQETAEGWTLLFNGTKTAMRGFKQDNWPAKGWEIADGVIRHQAGQGGGDIVTPEQYENFEFICEWKAAPKANSGIIYRCTEDHNASWETGYEMQILDDGGHHDGASVKTRAGTLYDIMPTAADVSRPAGQWNQARVVARGTKLEHWLNGIKVIEIDVASDAFKKAHAASKWPQFPSYGTRSKGHIALQDHGDLVEFRNLKVRRLD